MAGISQLDVIDLNEALLTAKGLRGSTLNRYSYGSDGEAEGECKPRYTRRKKEDLMIMSDAERTIFNKLGESSSPKNKVSGVFNNLAKQRNSTSVRLETK